MSQVTNQATSSVVDIIKQMNPACQYHKYPFLKGNEKELSEVSLSLRTMPFQFSQGRLSEQLKRSFAASSLASVGAAMY